VLNVSHHLLVDFLLVSLEFTLQPNLGGLVGWQEALVGDARHHRREVFAGADHEGLCIFLLFDL